MVATDSNPGLTSMARRTKILATIGPPSESPDTIRGMIRVGMDAVRINLSHGTLDEALVIHRRVREVAAAEGRTIGTLADLPGPSVQACSCTCASASTYLWRFAS